MPAPVQAGILPELTKEQRAAFELVHKFDCEQLKAARLRLEQAKKDVEYWESNEKASSAVSIRVVLTK